MRKPVIAALLAGLYAFPPAFAETEVDPAVLKAAEPLAGVYIFARNPEDNVTCLLYLEGKPDYTTMRAWVQAGCETQIFWMSDFSGWMPLEAGGVRLFGAELTPLMDFKPGKDGVLTTVSENDGKTYTLKRAPWVKD
ncbi:hypothetical protein sos41_20010 [Alphaproteobacteria bacterium SO-S41]|nr:hypothetical protein sos41_20010 [Alphaproteobacteria bacterium SO-S41]